MKKFLLILVGVLLVTKISYATDEVSDSLKNNPSVLVKDITGHVHEVDMRGFDSTNVSVLVNGRKTNAVDLSTVDWGQITLDQVDNIEVIKGPASVLYGDNSTGGVINIETKKNSDKPIVNIGSYIGSYGYYTENIGLLNKDYVINYRHKKENGYRDNAFADTGNFGANIGHGFNWGSVHLETGQYDATYGLPSALTLAMIDNFGRQHTKTPNDRVYTKDSYLRPIIDINDYEVSFAVRKKGVNYTTTGFDSSADTINYQTELKKTIKFNYNTTVLGLQYQLDRTNIETTYQPLTEIRKYDSSAFAHDIWRYSHYELNGGFRYQGSRYDFGSNGLSLINRVSTAGLAYHFLDESNPDTFKIFFNWGQGFRNPTTDEFFSYFTGLNPNIKPQKSDLYETGVYYDTAKTRYELTYFYITTKDEIYFDPYTYSNANLPETLRKGIELSASNKITDNFTGWLTYTYLDSYIKSTGNAIPQVPANKVSFGGSYRWYDYNFFGKWNYVGSRLLLNDFYGIGSKQKPYQTIDIGVTKTMKNASITFGVDNLFDVKYADLGVLVNHIANIYPNVDRTFYVKTNLTF